MTPKQKRIAELEGWIARQRGILAQIPSGVRSGAWSTDEALALAQIEQAETEIRALADLSDETCRVVTINTSSPERMKERAQEVINSLPEGQFVRRELYSLHIGMCQAVIQIEVAA